MVLHLVHLLYGPIHHKPPLFSGKISDALRKQNVIEFVPLGEATLLLLQCHFLGMAL